MTTETKALTVMRWLSVPLDSYRKQALQNHMVDGRMEELRITEHLKNVSDSLKTQIKEQQKKQTDAARALHAGFEMKDVACEQRADVEKNKMVTYRLDTGEPIEERALTKEEMVEARKGKKP